MTLEDLGAILRQIREEHLKMTQAEIAKMMKTDQNAISRLEMGKGGTLDLQLKILNYFKKRGVRIHMIFHEPFNMEDVLPHGESMNIEQIIQFIEKMQADNAQDTAMLKTLIKSLA